MKDIYGVENGLAAGYTPEQGGFEQELEDAATLGAIEAEYNRIQRAEATSKIAEKQRRIQQTKERKQRELVGPDPKDYGTDSWITRKSKELVNELLPHDYQIPVEMGGKQYNTQNKDFNQDDLSNIWNETEDNPYGDSVLYYMRKEDGYNDDGSVKWLYKPGIAKFGAFNRYKNQLANEGWQLLGEKRTNKAAEIEARIHGNQQFLQERTYDYGRSTTDPTQVSEDKALNTFGAGKSELYNKDILNLGNQSEQEIAARKILGLEKEAAYRKRKADDPDGRFGNLVDALQSRTVSTVAGMADAVYDTFSDDEHNALNDWKDTTKTDKLFGYNSNVSASGLDKAAMDFDNGNYLSMIGNAFAVAPELIAESIPEMASMMRGAAGLGAITAMRSNDVMDEILENNDGKISEGQRLQALTAGTLMTALDKFGLDEMVSRTAIGKNLVKKVFDNSTEQASKGIFTKLVEKTAQLSAAGYAEAGTEMMQEIVEAYGSKFGTKAENELWNDEMREQVIKAGLGGFSAGSTMRTGFDIIQGTADTIEQKNTEAGSDVPVHTQVNNMMVKASEDIESRNEPLTEEDIEVAKEGINEVKAAYEAEADPEVKLEIAEALLRSVDNVAAANVFTEEEHASEIESAKARVEQAKGFRKTDSTKEKKEDTRTQEEIDADIARRVEREERREAKKKAKKKKKTDDELSVPQETTKTQETFHKKIVEVGEKIINGEELGSKDLQVQQNNKKKLEKYLKQRQAEIETKPEPKQDKDVPGPLKAFFNMKDIVVEAIKDEPKVTKFKEVLKNAAGKFIKREASQRKQLKRKSEGIIDDTKVVNSFLHGATDEKIQKSPKLFKKQTDIQSKETKKEKNDLVENIKTTISKGSVSKSSAVNKKFNEMFEGTNEGGALRLAVLALNEITENMKSIVDRANNADFDIETIYSSRQDIAKEIGRKFVASYMQKFVPVGENLESNLAIDTEYINIGNVAIDMMESMGYIEFMPEKEGLLDVGSQNIYKDNNKFADRGETKKVDGKEVPYLTGDNVIMFKRDDAMKIRGSQENLRSNSLMSKYAEMLSPMIQALVPGNQRAPEHEPDFSDIEARDHVMSKSRNDTIVNMASQPIYIKPDMLELLKEIALATKNITLAEYMSKPKNKWAKIMFGIQEVEAIPTEQLSAVGKDKSRMSNAEAIIDAIKEYMEAEAAGETMNMAELYYTYFSAVNMRIHADEIAFNFQSDNFFTRHIMSPVEESYTTKSNTELEAEAKKRGEDPSKIISEVESLVLAIADELSTPEETITPAEVMFYQDPAENAQETILDGLNAMLEGGLKDTKYYYNEILLNDPRTKALFESGKSVNSVIKVLQAVQAVRDGVQKSDGDWTKAKITSNYAVEFDGNTSGLMNKLMNMLGGANNDAIFRMLENLSVAKDGKLGDGYLLLANEVEKLLNQKISEAEKSSADPIANKDVQELKSIVEFIRAIDADMRETSKSPMMTNLYGQMEESMSRLLGFNIVTKSLKKDMAEAKKIIRMLNGTDKAPANFTYKDKLELTNKVGSIIGEVFAKALDNLNAPLTEDSRVMYEAYDTMYKASRAVNQNLVMRSPFDVVYQKIFGKNLATTNKYGFSIEKKKIIEMGAAIVDSGSVIPTQEDFLSNQNSQKVMPLHAVDSAILLLAYEKTMRKLGKKFTGSMSVHDAVYSTPEFMNTFREMYNEAAFDVARHYDLINETLYQVEHLIKEMDKQDINNAVYNDLIKHRDLLKENQKERMALKEQELNKLQGDGASVFGTFDQSMPEVGQAPDPRPTKKVKKPTKKVEKSPEPEAKILDESKKVDPQANKKMNLNVFLKAVTSKNKLSADFLVKLLNNIKKNVNSEGKTHIDSIVRFIEEKGEVKKGKDFEYIPEKDLVTIPDKVYADPKSTEDVLRYMAHEIEHKATAQYLFNESKKKNPGKEYKYVKRFLDRLKKADISDIQYQEKNTFGQNTWDRVQYIIDPNKNEYEQMAEFVAIYRTNEDFRNVVKEKTSTSTGAINVLLKSIKDLVNKAMSALAKFDARDMSIDTLNNVMNNIVILGEQARQFENQDSATPLGAKTIKSEIDSSLNYRPYKGETPLYLMTFESKIVGFNAWAHEGMKKGINIAVSSISENEMIRKWHNNEMSNEEGIYYKTAKFIERRFEPGTFLSRAATYMQLGGQFDYKNIRQWHTAMNKAKQARNQIDTDLLIRAKREFDKTTKNYSVEEKQAIESIFNSSLVHELRNTNNGNSIIDQILESENPLETIDLFINNISEQLQDGDLKIMDYSIRNYTNQNGINNLAKDIASYYRTRKLGNLAKTGMNDHDVMARLGSGKLAAMKTLIALHQLKLGGQVEINTLNKFKKDSEKSGSGNSYNEFMMTSSSNHQISYMVDKDTEGRNQNRFDNVTGAHIMFDESYEFLAVDKQQLRNLKQEEDNNWIILQSPDPETKRIGIVARIRTDFGKQPGIVSGTNLNSDGVSILNKDAERMNFETSNIMRIGSRGNYEYKVILTNDMISKLKVTENPASVMYRSYAHNTEIFEGKSTLNHLLKTETKDISTKKDADWLEDRLKNNEKIDYIFINFDRNSPEINLSDYPLISKHYNFRNDMTNVLGFNQRANMVHKNLEDTMVGYTRDALTSSKNPKLRKGEAILRNFVTMFAGHVVMANPAKITFDALSNLSILVAHNVPFLSMAKYGKEAMKWGVEITELRNKYIEEQMLMFSYDPGSEEYIKQKEIADKAYDKVQKHPFATALNNGMIQSLSTAMMMKDKESMSSLQKSANALFEKIGDIPGAKKAIFGFAKFGSKYGLGVEDVLSYAQNRAKKGSTIEKELKYMKEKFERIKKEEDLAAYLSEIVATPGQSEIIRIGGVAVLGVDLASKWILYKHTVDTFKEDPRMKRMTELQRQELAIEIAVNSFINYMDNLPHEIDQAKEVGAWMFPHFLLRVQKVIWGLFYNRMFGSGAATVTAAISGTFGPTIYGSAFPLKTPSHFDPGINAFIPSEVANIPFV